jgi:hypothetical protein
MHIAANVRHRHMNEIRTRVVAGSDHRLAGTAPAAVPAGEHEVIITLADRPARERAAQPGDLPRHDLGTWPKDLSLRREDLYGDDDHCASSTPTS